MTGKRTALLFWKQSRSSNSSVLSPRPVFAAERENGAIQILHFVQNDILLCVSGGSRVEPPPRPAEARPTKSGFFDNRLCSSYPVLSIAAPRAFAPFAGCSPARWLFRNAFGALSLRRLHACGVPPPAAEEKIFAGSGSGSGGHKSEMRIRALQPLIEKPDLLSGAANGETVRTVVVELGEHAGTVEAQVRPVHARRRRRRTAPGVTDRAHIAQAAGIAGAATRSGVEVSSARSAKYKLRLLLRSLNRTLASP